MSAIKIVEAIGVALIGLGIFVALITSIIIEYKRQRKIIKTLNYLQTYYKFYYPAIDYKTNFEATFADDIYFVMGKHFPYDECKELAKLLAAIGYRKK